MCALAGFLFELHSLFFRDAGMEEKLSIFQLFLEAPPTAEIRVTRPDDGKAIRTPRFFAAAVFPPWSIHARRKNTCRPAAANENTQGSKEITYNYYLLTCFLHRHDKPLQFPSHPSPFSHLKTTQREVKTEGKGKEEEVNRFEISPPPFFSGAHTLPIRPPCL